MSKEKSCPICLHSNSAGARAVISPWVRNLGIRKRTSKYYICSSCTAGYFSYRYNDAEMSRIYFDYRGVSYLSIRSKWEPWYSSAYNENHNSSDWIQSRKQSLESFLGDNGVHHCDSIVDVGGDQGQYIPDITSNKIVFDISDKPNLEGIQKYSNFNDLPLSDLIIYAHVLEHVADPVYELTALFQKSNNVYIEVPYGVPVINKFRTSLTRHFLHLLASYNLKLWGRFSQPAAGRQVSLKKQLTQSEHLSFFNEQAMKYLAIRLNAQLVFRRTTINTPDLNKSEVLQCLFRVR